MIPAALLMAMALVATPVKAQAQDDAAGVLTHETQVENAEGQSAVAAEPTNESGSTAEDEAASPGERDAALVEESTPTASQLIEENAPTSSAEAEDSEELTDGAAEAAEAEEATDGQTVDGDATTHPEETAEGSALDGVASTTDETTASAVEAADGTAETPKVDSEDTLKKGVAASDSHSASSNAPVAVTEKVTAQSVASAELPKGAVNVKNGTYVIETSVADDKVLGVSDKEPAGFSAVTSVTYKGTANQKWVVEKDAESGWYHILLSGTSRPLALGKAASSDTLQLLYPERVGDRALWAFVKNGSWFNLINRSMPERLLAVSGGSKANGAALSLPKSSDASAGSRFYLLDTRPQVKASDSIVEGAYEIAYSQNTKIAADVQGGKATDKANVLLYTYSGKNSQKVYLESDGKGFYTAWILGTRKVLAQSSSSIVPGNNVIQKTYSAGTATQLWALHRNTDGTYSLVNKATGLALGSKGTTSGSNLIGTRDDGYKTTRFKLVRQALLSSGIVEIHPRTTAKVTLDVQKAASKGSANLLLWEDGDKLNQRFELVAAGGTDLWRIRTASSGGWITASGIGVQQMGNGFTAKTSANTWKVTFKGGWYSLVNVATGKALDMRYGKTNNGTKIIAYTPNGRDSQHFTFVKADLVPEGYYTLRTGTSNYLDVKGASRRDGANVGVYKKTGGLNQVFHLQKDGSSWVLRNANSGLYVTASSAKNSANVAQKSGGKGKTQQWVLGIADGGGIVFKSAANQKLVLNTTSKRNVTVATSTKAAAQAWKPVTVISDGTLTTRQQRVLSSANRTPSPGGGLCAGWVTNVFQNAGIGSWYGDARDQYDWFCKSADLTKLKPGMIVAVRTHGKTWAGSIWGHVGIYVGDGNIKDNIGYIRTISVFDWLDFYGDQVTPKWGWFGKSLR